MDCAHDGGIEGNSFLPWGYQNLDVSRFLGQDESPTSYKWCVECLRAKGALAFHRSLVGAAKLVEKMPKR